MLGFSKKVLESSVEYRLVEVGSVVDEVSHHLDGETWVLLSGDLGAGKTTFVQSLGGRLGVSGPITSPTFAVMNCCAVNSGDNSSIRKLVHLDLYRIKSARELLFLGIEAEITPDSLVCVEWPELVDDLEWEDFFATTRCPPPARIIKMEIAHHPSVADVRCYRWSVLES